LPPLTDEADVTLAKRQRLLCGTQPPFADAAIAHAESLRSRSAKNSAVQRISRNQSFTRVDLAKFQTALSPQMELTIETRIFPTLTFRHVADAASVGPCGALVASTRRILLNMSFAGRGSAVPEATPLRHSVSTNHQIRQRHFPYAAQASVGMTGRDQRLWICGSVAQPW